MGGEELGRVDPMAARSRCPCRAHGEIKPLCRQRREGGVLLAGLRLQHSSPLGPPLPLGGHPRRRKGQGCSQRPEEGLGAALLHRSQLGVAGPSGSASQLERASPGRRLNSTKTISTKGPVRLSPGWPLGPMIQPAIQHRASVGQPCWH